MIAEVEIFYFKSYREAIIPLSPLTLLIGANASGKTNCIESLRFLSRLAYGQRIDDILEDVRQNDLAIRGKVADMVYDGSETSGEAPVIGFVVRLVSTSTIEWDTLFLTISMQPAPIGSRVIDDEIAKHWEGHTSTLYATKPQDMHRHEAQVYYMDFHGTEPRPTIYCSNCKLPRKVSQ